MYIPVLWGLRRGRSFLAQLTHMVTDSTIMAKFNAEGSLAEIAYEGSEWNKRRAVIRREYWMTCLESPGVSEPRQLAMVLHSRDLPATVVFVYKCNQYA